MIWKNISNLSMTRSHWIWIVYNKCTWKPLQILWKHLTKEKQSVLKCGFVIQKTQCHWYLDIENAIKLGSVFKKVHSDDISEFVINHEEVLKKFGDRCQMWCWPAIHEAELLISFKNQFNSLVISFPNLASADYNDWEFFFIIVYWVPQFFGHNTKRRIITNWYNI